MKITGIQKQSTTNILLVFDSGEKLILSYEVFLKKGLRKDSEISEDLLSTLREENEGYLVRQNAFRILNRRSHSEWELKIKLIKKGFRGDLVNEAITILRLSGYLDDHNFAAAFRDEKILRFGWGKELVSAGLRKKGINAEIIKDVLYDLAETDLLEKALTLLNKKYRLKAPEDLAQSKIKMSAFLYSKGYGYDICRNAVDQYIISRTSPED